MKRPYRLLHLLFLGGLLLSSARGTAQDQPRINPPPQLNSVEVSQDHKVTFRILAPNAQAVRLFSSDIPGLGRGLELKKNDNGFWEGTTDSVPAGAYRYNFVVDGVTVLDPRNPITSESNTNAWSLLYVPGSETSDLKQVPHGALTELNYYSKALDKPRRLHVYTPPGYGTSGEEYPVLYLFHGAFDSDDSWSTVGRANFILDNLIASGKCKPMIVVMPNGHVGPFRFGPPGEDVFGKQIKGFKDEFVNDIRPLIETRMRVKPGRENRAIAGLSMGGMQTLEISFSQLNDFAYIGVFSSGIFGIGGNGPGAPPGGVEFDKVYADALKDAELKKGLKLFWFATGKEDFLLDTSRKTVDMFKSHGFDVVYEEGEGGHTWINWRAYLAEFAPKLFQ